MAERNLFCDKPRCGKPAQVFGSTQEGKIKVCSVHLNMLEEKGVRRTLEIADYDLMEDGVRRQSELENIAKLKVRCECDFEKAQRRLQSVRASVLEQLEQTFLEMQRQVQQTYEKIQDRLNEERHSWEQKQDVERRLQPNAEIRFRQINAAEPLLLVQLEDCSLLLAETLFAHFKVRGSREQQSLKSTDLMQLHPPQPQRTVTEQNVTEEASHVISVAQEARAAGNYQQAMEVLQSWKVRRQQYYESPEFCLQLGLALIHFAQRKEAERILRQGLELSPLMSKIRLQLSVGLAESFFQGGQWEKTIEICEETLLPWKSRPCNYEMLCLLYYFVSASLSLEHTNAHYVNQWMANSTDTSQQCHSVLLCIHAELDREGGLEEAAESALEHLPLSYITICILHKLSWQRFSKHQVQAAEATLQQTLQRLRTHFPHSLEYACCLCSLGQFYEALNQLNKAVSSLKQAYEAFNANFPESLDFAQCLSCLGFCYELLEQPDLSEEFYQKACELCAEHFPAKKQYARCLENLAFLLTARNKLKEAKTHYEKACEVYSQHFPQSLEFAHCLNNFGYFYGERKPQKEMDLYLRAIQVYRADKRPSLGLAKCLSNLAFRYAAMGEFEAAEKRYQEACELYRDNFALTLEYANCLNNRGLLQSRMKMAREADQMFCQARRIYEEVAPESNELTQCLLNHEMHLADMEHLHADEGAKNHHGDR